MEMKLYLSVFLTLVLTASLSYAHEGEDSHNFNPKNEEVSIEKSISKAIGIKTIIIESKTVDDVIVTSGQIEEIPKNHFDINTPVQGTISSILIDLGDKISTGQSLVSIQSTEIAKLQAEIDQAKAELELAKSNFEREKSLFENQISAKKDFDASKAILKSTEARLKAGESNLRILTGLSSSNGLGTFQIKAKKSGTVVERHITQGQVVGANQLLFHAIDLSTLWASANIYEKDVSKVALGQKVLVKLDENKDTVYEGRLSYIGSLIDERSRTLPVKAVLTNDKNSLKPGTFVQLTIHTNKKKNAILIPSKAIVDTDDERDEEHKHIVYIKDGEIYKPREIKVSSHNDEFAEVVYGLKPGEILVTDGSYQLQYAESNIPKEENNHAESKTFSHVHENKDNGSSNYFLPGIIGLLIGIAVTLTINKKNK